MDAVLKVDRDRIETEIIAALAASIGKPVEWGKDDCSLWCADILRAIVGYDPASELRGKYRTRRGARRKLGKRGLSAALWRAARRNGWKRINPAMARAGDIGLIKGKHGASTVICRGRGWFVGRDEGGFAALRADNVAIAWAIDGISDPVAGRHLATISTRPQFIVTSAALHDPISATLAVVALVQSFAATTIGSIVIGLSVTVGLSYLSALLTPKPGLPSPSGINQTQQSSQFTERQPTPSKTVIFGAAYVGGALFFEQVKPPYLYMGLLINHGEITGVDNIWIGTNKLVFTSISFSTILVPLPIAGQPSYNTRLEVSLRPGTTTQSLDPILSADFSPIDPNFLQTGIATAVFRYHFGADQTEFTALWGQVARPSAYLLVRGVAVYDPRDPTQDVNDETTWKWSNNASLVQAYYLTRDYGGRIPAAKIRWDKVAVAANYDDDAVGCKDGTFIKRYTIDGVTTLNQKPSDVMTQMLTANAGSIIQSGGQYWVNSSRPRTPIATIYDAILSGALEVRCAQPKANMINKLQVRFVAQEQDYQTIDGPILDRLDLEATDQETLTSTLELPYTLDYRRAERLQKLFLERSRLGRTVTCTVDISFLANLDDDLVGEAVTVSSDLFPIANGTYLCSSVSFADDISSLALVLTEYDPTIESDWNPSVDEADFVVAPVLT